MSETCQSELAIVIDKVAHYNTALHLANHECYDHRKKQACDAGPGYHRAKENAEDDLQRILKRCKFGEGTK